MLFAVYLCSRIWFEHDDEDMYHRFPISLANRTSALLWLGCGKCYSAAAVLVSREIWPSYDELVW